MARIRSPGYPSFSLEETIEFAKKIHAADRQHPVDRENAARHMGFSGLSGASDRALSALMHYGFSEKVQKGELRITDLALEIIHPHSVEERRAALHKAGFMPELFAELRERYPEAPPSREILASYLSRSGFASTAINPATKAYLETCYFLQRERAYESDVDASASPPEPAPVSEREEPMQSAPAPMSAAHLTTPVSAPLPTSFVATPSSEDFILNDIQTHIKGGTVRIEALLDARGLRRLEKKIAALKLLLEPDEDEDDEDLVG